MRTNIIAAGITSMLLFIDSYASANGEVLTGFQCVGLNANQLHLSPEDIYTGARNPWILEEPNEDAKPVAKVPNIAYIAWPPVVENGFVKAMSLGGKVGWLEQKAIRPLRRADGTTGGCTLTRRSDGRIILKLDPGVGVAY